MKTKVEGFSQACVRENAWMDHSRVAVSNDLCAEKGFSGQMTTGYSSVLPLALPRLKGAEHGVFPSPLLSLLALAPGMAEVTHRLFFFL